MFNHLKAEEFINLLEGPPDGTGLPAKRRAHLDSCARCSAALVSTQSMHRKVSNLDNEIPEPDWSEFRSSVRNELLSRSIQRASAVRRWTGWPIRPATAWALSLILVAGVTGVLLMRPAAEEQPAPVPPPLVVNVEPAPAMGVIDFSGIKEEIEMWSQKNVFDELAQLGEKEQEELRRMLQSAQEQTAARE